MCGIAGLYDPSADLYTMRQRLAKASQLLRHRGPDEEGGHVNLPLGLLSRRLSIIDLQHGQQPMSNEDGSLWLVCNGEIYNAAELRQQLQSMGHLFRTHSDIETILHAWESWGEQALSKLRGMFAFALWDARHQRLWLARDRFGIKPLFYAQSANGLAFASECRALFALLPDLPRQANREALGYLFQVGFVPNPMTAFDQIWELPAAHLLCFEDGRLALRRYWKLEYARHSVNRSFRLASRQFVERLEEAIHLWSLSDVPVGALLSGGIDSSTVAYFAAREITPLQTFSVGFDNWKRDESHRARDFAKQLGARHHLLNYGPEAIEQLPFLVWHQEEPQCMAVSLAFSILYRQCHQAGFKVILTGEGADELLGGYLWHDLDARIRPFLGLPRWARRVVYGIGRPFLGGTRRRLLQGTADPVQRYLLWLRFDHPGLANLLQFDLPAVPLEEIWRAQVEGELQGLAPFHQFQLLESRTRLVDWINVNVDRMSMAHSVEARTPFLDHLLWEFVAQFPPSWKVNLLSNKRLLREGTHAHLPDEIRRRPKRGLATPDHWWWQADRLPDWAEELLTPAALQGRGYFQPAEVARLRQLTRLRHADHSRTLTGVLTTQIWHDQFLLGRQGAFVHPAQGDRAQGE